LSRRTEVGQLWYVDVACGGDPARAVLRAVSEILERQSNRGEVWRLGSGHDDGCPAMEGEGMESCSCEIVQLEARRAA
jgi:hypothetical protein